jgi:fructokinase
MDNGLAVLTYGEGGSRLYSDDMDIRQNAYNAETVGDTVGAGDTFFSAMVAQLLRDGYAQNDLTEKQFAYALRFGAVAAALNVEKIGCHPPTCDEVLSRM